MRVNSISSNRRLPPHRADGYSNRVSSQSAKCAWGVGVYSEVRTHPPSSNFKVQLVLTSCLGGTNLNGVAGARALYCK